MQINILHGPGASAAEIQLAPREKVTAEAGAMIAMSGGVQIETSTHKKGSGGILSGLKRMVSGESFFLNHFTAPHDGGTVHVATSLPGDMTVLDLNGSERIIVQSGSFVASEENVEFDLGWQGFKSLFSKEGLFWINASGHGKMVINSFGAIYAIDVTDEFIVDTGHIVAFEETLTFNLSKAGKSWISSFLGGEGLVCRFSGTGKVWCQSHNAPGFGKRLGGMLKPRS